MVAIYRTDGYIISAFAWPGNAGLRFFDGIGKQNVIAGNVIGDTYQIGGGTRNRLDVYPEFEGTGLVQADFRWWQ